MIAVGIPTLNEADNIGNLTKKIDKAASKLNTPLLIINCDNSSQDGTASVFKQTRTKNKKISLTAIDRGKGRTIKQILDYVCDKKIDYCFFIDGDVSSFESCWLEKHLYEARNGSDYVVPNYTRNWQDGNITNHFVYPQLRFITKGHTPRQPIAGDFGLSLKMAKYFQSMEWDENKLGFGIDIFMTIQALFNGFKVVEIDLPIKNHKPSFDKMTEMFVEVASSYYLTIISINTKEPIHFCSRSNKLSGFSSAQTVSGERIKNRIATAKDLFDKNGSQNLISTWPTSNRLLSHDWAQVLAEHQKKIATYDPNLLAKSIAPFYILRVATYFTEFLGPNEAFIEINEQADIISKALEAIVIRS